jgi:hypothetical protein
MPPKPPPLTEEEFQRTLTHAKAGYSNAQDIIKFLDAKAGALLGIVSLMLGLPLLLAKWVLEQPATAQFHLPLLMGHAWWWCFWTGVLAVLSLGAGALSMCQAVAAVRARLPKSKAKIPVLMPLHPPGDYRQAVRSFGRLRRGLKREEILREYELQLTRLGQILSEKAVLVSRAAWLFRVQFLLFILLVVTFFAARLGC